MNSLFDHTSNLDPDQQKAAQHSEGHAVVLAGPGSGKTRTIVCRVAQLYERGLSPDQVLCITFSRAAAEEMRNRIQELTHIPAKRLNNVCTFHSLALKIVKEASQNIQICLPGDVKRLLRTFVPKGEDINEIVKVIGFYRRSLIHYAQAEQKNLRYAKYYKEYHYALIRQNKIDFDSMVFTAVNILNSVSGDAEKWLFKFKHVIVDETHDTSKDQAELARLLSINGSLFVVGDPSQSIYGFRGASNDLLKAVGVTPYILGRNYRSGREIIDAFKPHAERDPISIKLAEAMHPAGEETGLVKYHAFRDENEQLSGVISLIKNGLTREKPSKFAVLSRTRALLAPYADALGEIKVPYKWLGKNFWTGKEVQDALAFLRYAVNPNDIGSFVRMVCSTAECVKFIGKAFAEDIAQSAAAQEIQPLHVDEPSGEWPAFRIKTWNEAREILLPLMSQHDKYSPATFLDAVMRRAGFNPGEDDEADDYRKENVQQLVQRATRFTSIREFLLHADKMAKQQSRSEGVILSTIHGAKGLEWDNVFVIGVTEGILPHQKSTDLNEERRILYVGLSRARKELHVCWFDKPSRFIKEKHGTQILSRNIGADSDSQSVGE